MAIVSDKDLERLRKSFCESGSESESESENSDISDNVSVNSLYTTSSVSESPTEQSTLCGDNSQQSTTSYICGPLKTSLA